jgi:N,N-dimethylformamidase
VDPDRPYVIEVRRGFTGTRDWTSEAGELYHSTTGEYGGLWRYRGRSPNQLAGVGFSAMGGAGASGYARQAGSFQKDVSFIFRGIADDEVIGNFGAIDGGAAGDEVDRLDVKLGSPPSAVLLASTNALSQSYLIVIEDNTQTVRNQDATNNPRARADIVFYTTVKGGAVFSVGSINWFGSLDTNGDDNNVSRVTENVIRHFIGREEPN